MMDSERLAAIISHSRLYRARAPHMILIFKKTSTCHNLQTAGYCVGFTSAVIGL